MLRTAHEVQSSEMNEDQMLTKEKPVTNTGGTSVPYSAALMTGETATYLASKDQ